MLFDLSSGRWDIRLAALIYLLRTSSIYSEFKDVFLSFALPAVKSSRRKSWTVFKVASFRVQTSVSPNLHKFCGCWIHDLASGLVSFQQQQQKAHETALMQLNEQLQLNLVQQSQLIQDKKTNGKHTQQQLQQLALQQQTIVSQIQQIQLQQRQLLLACLMQPFSSQPGKYRTEFLIFEGV